MNAVTTRPNTSTALAINEDEAIRVLQNSLYPGARPESVALVLAWCRATGRDPMKKPIHIVPMWVKDAVTGQGAMRDVLMPGIGTYRTDAARTGLYAGKSEPEFGPDVTLTLDGVRVTVPKWCKVTVFKFVASETRPFTAMEFWQENYATAKKDTEAPNAMRRRRPYGQLAKCAESQALRMAFPDETGNTNTAEEMEGKTFEGVTLDAQSEPPQPAAPRVRDAVDADTIPALDAGPQPDRQADAADRLIARILACQTEDALHAISGDAKIADWRTKVGKTRPELETRIAEAFGATYQTLVAAGQNAQPKPVPPADDPVPADEAPFA